MEATYWHDKWATGTLGFHKTDVHPMLAAHVETLGSPGGRIFLPLCGKTLDAGWLLARGYRVAGAELSETAVEALFAGLGIEPERAPAGSLMRYSAEGIDIFAGDIFDLDAATLGPVDAVYDRAALVALPAAMRARYAEHLAGITATARQLLVTFDYDQAAMDGPPFSVPEATIRALHGPRYRIEPLASEPVPGGLKGRTDALEQAWALTPV